MTTNTIECVDLEVSFGSASALSRTTLQVAPEETVAIMGPSGSGKTTLLRVMQGLTSPTAGSIKVLGQDQGSARRRERAALRRRQMGLVSQNPDLLPEFSALENVALPLMFDGVRRPEALDAGRAALHHVGLDHRCHAEVASLSGGEAQRVAVARAIVREDVRLLIADEPTASLDVENAQSVTTYLLEYAAQRMATLVLATHDPRVAERCDRIIHIYRAGTDL